MIPPWRPLGTLSTGKMVVLPLFRKLTCLANKRQASSETGIVKLFYSSDSHTQLPLPSYKPRENESVEKLRARLLYQSRKRGMLENDLLLSNFASKYLHKFNAEELRLYDTLINKPSNDWEIYYWATETNPTPLEYDTEIMKLLKVFTKNKDKSSRVRQPDLYSS